ncbi:MAG: hypothetical protein KAT17_06580, partial [Candidatus Aminicenantes bacterium]|nr:hypothetical protein [Candidatus Aminicenantes bacterium]
TRKLIFQLPANQQGSIGFERSQYGKHKKFISNFVFKANTDDQKVNVFFKVYKILIELLKTYDHSCLPVLNLNELDSKTVWQSPPLDFSPYLNRVGWGAARIMKQFVIFRQKKSFRLQYGVTSMNDSEVEICGEAHPDVKVWGSFKIRDVYRKVKFRSADSVLISDMISLDIRNKKGVGGYAQIILKLMQ